MGLHAFAMSRFAGVWTSMKTIQEVVESSSSVQVDPERVKIILPEDFAMPPGGVHMRWPDAALEQEARLFDYKWYAALAYVRANKLNHDVIRSTPRPLRHHRQRQGLQRHAPGAVRPGPGRGRLPPAGHPAAQGQRGVAAGGHHHAQLRRRAAGDPGRRGEAPGHRVPGQGRALQLAHRRAPARAGQVRGRRRRHSGGEWSRPNPSQNWLLRAKADLTPAIVARPSPSG
jgi:indolepyruvate ferredoxin oxidoreductase